jgi:hypothetical protein
MTFKRHPPYYDGSSLTTRPLSQLLPRFLEEIGRKCEERHDLVIAAWPAVIGSQLAHMTEATAFIDGVLTVKVRNSPLYALLVRDDRSRLIKNLRDKFPGVTIKTISFRLG